MQYIALLSVLGLASTVVATGNFQESCPTNNLYYATLISNCGANRQQYSIDLNEYIGNVNGQLVWQSRGFAGTCGSGANGNCNLYFSSMTCDCNNGAGQIVQSTIDLSTHIGFNGNDLVYE